MARILLIEDNESLRRLYTRDLEEDGHEVVAAESARHGLRLFEDRPPHLVIMDIRPPAMDGLDAMARIRHRDPKVPVVLNSGYSPCTDNVLSWAADACLIKSEDTTELLSTIRALLDARSQGRP